ncbi:MAG TPA: AsmA family protein, partial [Gammaproteobacteria bacterium]|nr:AsmA family protein [Gammaproteobacteria bacterium]
KRVLKILGLAVGAVVVLLVVVAVAVTLLFDPNDYKDEITAAVQDATGRQLTLDGDLELAVFPTIRIAVGSASLSNAPGFGSEPMARIGSAELRVALFPLLAQRIEVSRARLEGLELNLARNRAGANNWQDLGGRPAAAGGAPASADGGSAPASLDLGVGAIEIENARIVWNDAAAGSRWELTNFGMTAEEFGLGERFPLHMEFKLAGAEVAVQVAADMQATITLADNSYRLDELAVTVDGSGAGWPGGPSQAKLNFDSLAANLADETLELNGLTLEFLGITMVGSLSGQKLLSNLALTGAVDIREFAPREVLERFGVDVQTADESVLTRASAKANLLYNSSQTGLRDMQLELDDSTLTGRVALEGERITYELTVDDINVDRYLPPASQTSDAPAEEGSLDEVDLPLEVMKTVDARGELKFGKAKFSGLTLTNVAFPLTVMNGAARLTPSAQLYGGRFSGDIRVAVEGDSANMTVQQTLDDVDLAALGQDLLGSQDVTGTGDVRLNLVSKGQNLGQVRRDLDGDVSFSVTNGSLEGIDLWFELRRARARLDNETLPERGDAVRRTTFSSLSATGVVEDALLTNRDLNGTLDFMTVDGSGTVNLLDDKIAFDLVAKMVDGPVLQSDPAMVKYAGKTLPLKVTGTIDAPSVLPDFSAIVRQQISQGVDDKVEQEKEEVQERVRDRLRGLLNR